jgi:uncharacterized membrane-anchored protein YhcB (DUF1043 family)
VVRVEIPHYNKFKNIKFQLLQNFFKTSSKLLQNFFKTSSKLLQNFFKTSSKLLQNFFKPAKISITFQSSSMAEQSAVNRSVEGSIPSSGVLVKFSFCKRDSK